MEHFRAAGELSVKLILILGLTLLTVSHHQAFRQQLAEIFEMPSKEIKIQNSGNLFLSL